VYLRGQTVAFGNHRRQLGVAWDCRQRCAQNGVLPNSQVSKKILSPLQTLKRRTEEQRRKFEPGGEGDNSLLKFVSGEATIRNTFVVVLGWMLWG